MPRAACGRLWFCRRQVSMACLSMLRHGPIPMVRLHLEQVGRGQLERRVHLCAKRAGAGGWGRRAVRDGGGARCWLEGGGRRVGVAQSRAAQHRNEKHPHPDPDPAQARLPYPCPGAPTLPLPRRAYPTPAQVRLPYPWPGAPTLPLPRRAYPTPAQARLHETLRQAVERHAAQILAAVDDHEA